MPRPENYIRTIYELTNRGEDTTTTSEVAGALNISDASASEAIQRLEDENTVCRAPYRGITLSPLGKQKGKALHKKHVKLRDFFKWLDVENPEKEAESVEHAISTETVDKMIGLVR